MDPATIALIASLSGAGIQGLGGYLSSKGQEKSDKATRAMQTRFHEDDERQRAWENQFREKDATVKRPGDFITMMQALGNLRKSVPQASPLTGMRLAAGTY